MAFLNQKLWRSAYLIEFMGSTGLEDAFTFSVAPQSEEFVFAQRINETKTFGGSVFDDYGNDSVKITLSGTTINQELKVIYRSSLGNKYLNGEDEVFELKDLLEKYGRYNNLDGKKVYLYSLTSGKKDKGGKNHKAWRIFVNEFQVKRSKDMPFTYFYTLNATGVDLETDLASSNRLLNKIKNSKFYTNLTEAYKNCTEALETGLNFYSSVLSYVDDLTDLSTSLQSKVEYVGELIDSYESMTSGAISSIANIVEDTVGLGNSIIKTALKLTPISLATNLYNSTNEVVSTFNELKSWWKDFAVEEEWDKVCSNYAASKEAMTDTMDVALNIISGGILPLVESVARLGGSNSTEAVINPGTTGEDDSILFSSGYSEYSFSDGDTWASLSNKFYGSTDYAMLLQLYNPDTEIETLAAGTIIYIPKINNQTETTSDNLVYNAPGVKDIYGIDIDLTSDGDFDFKNNDFVLTKGINNLNQAILNRLATSINSRVRNVVYGIRNEVGNSSVDASAIASYITSSIQQTILTDPRVDTIESLDWDSSDGKSITVNLTYKTTVGKLSSYSVTI